MSTAADSRRVQRSLPVAAGLSLIVGTFVVNTLLDGPGTSALCGGAPSGTFSLRHYELI